MPKRYQRSCSGRESSRFGDDASPEFISQHLAHSCAGAASRHHFVYINPQFPLLCPMCFWPFTLIFKSYQPPPQPYVFHLVPGYIYSIRVDHPSRFHSRLVGGEGPRRGPEPGAGGRVPRRPASPSPWPDQVRSSVPAPGPAFVRPSVRRSERAASPKPLAVAKPLQAVRFVRTGASLTGSPPPAPSSGASASNWRAHRGDRERAGKLPASFFD